MVTDKKEKYYFQNFLFKIGYNKNKQKNNEFVSIFNVDSLP